MGIYSRYSTAFLTAFLACSILSAPTSAATRKTPSITPSNKDIISNPSSAAFQTPSGNAAFYGQEFVDKHEAGGRFQAGNNPSATLPKYQQQIIKLKPVVSVPKTRIFTALKNGLKANPASIAMQAATAAAIAGVGWVMSPENTQLQMNKPSTIDGPIVGNQFRWRILYSSRYFQSPAKSCDDYCSTISSCTVPTLNRISDTSYRCYAGTVNQYIERVGSGCPPGSTYDNTLSSCTVPKLSPVTDADLDLIDPWLNAQSAAWLGGLLKEVCGASTSPNACFDSMKDTGYLTGPAQQVGPKYSSSETTLNPDGSTSVTTTTSQDTYNYKYGDNFYDFSTKTTTTTNKDGQTTVVTSDDSQPEGETPAEEQKPEEDEEEPEYTYDDAPFPPVEPFYQQKYPEGLAGVWTSAKSDIDNSQFMSFLHSFVPSFSGSCPSFGLIMNISSWANYGTQQFPSLCYVFDFIKVLMLVTAVFTARALTFGG
ncbi:MAG: hypothetical protein ACRD9S_21360 [Pyrinomonadaceae bacterium]